MTNTINDATIALGKEYEGLELEAYPDPGSKNGIPWTIGRGHTGLLTAPSVSKGMSITLAQADQYYTNDLNAAAARVSALVKVPLNDNQFGALVLFYMNLGETQFKKSSVLKYINAKRMDEVPGRMALYRYNDGKVMAGLVRRRADEGALWMRPVDGVTVPHTDAGSNKPAQPAQNDKKPWDWGAAGAFVTLMASMSGDAKTVIGNVTNALGVSPLIVLAVVGAGFAVWTLYNKFKKEH